MTRPCCLVCSMAEQMFTKWTFWLAEHMTPFFQSLVMRVGSKVWPIECVRHLIVLVSWSTTSGKRLAHVCLVARLSPCCHCWSRCWVFQMLPTNVNQESGLKQINKKWNGCLRPAQVFLAKCMPSFLWLFAWNQVRLDKRLVGVVAHLPHPSACWMWQLISTDDTAKPQPQHLFQNYAMTCSQWIRCAPLKSKNEAWSHLQQILVLSYRVLNYEISHLSWCQISMPFASRSTKPPKGRRRHRLIQ